MKNQHHLPPQEITAFQKKIMFQYRNSPLYKDGLQWVGVRTGKKSCISLAFLHKERTFSCSVADSQELRWQQRGGELAAGAALGGTAFYPKLCDCTTSLQDMLSNRTFLLFLVFLFVLVHLKIGKINDKKKKVVKGKKYIHI